MYLCARIHLYLFVVPVLLVLVVVATNIAAAALLTAVLAYYSYLLLPQPRIGSTGGSLRDLLVRSRRSLCLYLFLMNHQSSCL